VIAEHWKCQLERQRSEQKKKKKKKKKVNSSVPDIVYICSGWNPVEGEACMA
jgi:hypothetical protein